MCGFICVYNDEEFDLSYALKSIKHRGPDSSKQKILNKWQIGFNRLAITAPVADFDQPYSEAPDEDCLVFNGEIYNFKELQNELNMNNISQSDTQILYKLLKDKKHKIIPKLNGIFSFAYINFLRKEVLLSRDFFGVKPLYYLFNENNLYISSEIGPIKSHINAKFNKKGLIDYLAYGKNWNNETIFQSIKQCDPGEYIYFNLQNMDYKKNSFEIESNSYFNFINSSEVLNKAVKSQMPQIPFGILFSGGIDSTLLLLESKSNKFLDSLFSISIDKNEMDESFWQEYAIKKLNVLIDYIKVNESKNDFTKKDILNSVNGLDLPITHPNFIGALKLSRKASEKGLKVLLSGEGADELFCGYKWHLQNSIDMESILGYVPSKIIAKLLGFHDYIPPDFSELKIDDFFIKNYLQRWLTRADLTGMKYSIETRVPFLSNIVYQFSQSLSQEEKTFNKRIGKKPLKDIIIKSLGNKFTYRNKRGFDYPLNTWIDASLENLVLKRTNYKEKDIHDLLVPYNKNYLYSRVIFILASFFLWEKENFL